MSENCEPGELREAQRLAEERGEHLSRLNALIRVSSVVLAETTLEGMLRKVVDAARELTEAKIGVSGHGYRDGVFQIGATSRAEERMPCPPGEVFAVAKGGVYLDLIQKQSSIRLTDAELLRHPAWWGLPEGHAPVRGLLGVRLTGTDGQANGLIMVSDKAEGDFTAEDEALLTQLATLASLGFQHIEARDEAERQRAQLDAVFDAMTDGVTVYSAEGVPVKCNQAEIAALGLDPVGGDRETLRKTLKVRHVDGRPVAPADLPSVRALRGETVGEEAFLFTNVNGEEFSILASGSPLCKDGKVVGALTVWRNITEREWLLQQIQRQVAELNAANRELELFAYSVSHDLRAPLRGIDGFANALLEDYADLLDDQGKRYLAFVRQESQRMGQLIDAVLELSRIARWEMRRGRVDLSELARQVARGLQLAEPERSVEFAIALGLMANGDARLLKVVLENLLENAWKFTSKRPTAKIEFGATEHEGSRAYYVRDDGAGFEPGYAGKLFGPFQRLHGEGEFPGTGIGLATVQRIVSRHGGRVWAEGALEGGATFYFTLLA